MVVGGRKKASEPIVALRSVLTGIFPSMKYMCRPSLSLVELNLGKQFQNRLRLPLYFQILTEKGPSGWQATKKGKIRYLEKRLQCVNSQESQEV